MCCMVMFCYSCCMVDRVVVFGLNGPLKSISVYIGPSPREKEKEEK